MAIRHSRESARKREITRETVYIILAISRMSSNLSVWGKGDIIIIQITSLRQYLREYFRNANIKSVWNMGFRITVFQSQLSRHKWDSEDAMSVFAIK